MTDTSICEYPLNTGDDGFSIDGVMCGQPATWISCIPFSNTPTCDAHKCRCRKPIDIQSNRNNTEPEKSQQLVDAFSKKYPALGESIAIILHFAREQTIEECAKICDTKEAEECNLINYHGSVALDAQGIEHRTASNCAGSLARQIRALKNSK